MGLSFSQGDEIIRLLERIAKAIENLKPKELLETPLPPSHKGNDYGDSMGI